ncbi:unnamed protein product [Rhizopus microsporus]
MTTNQDNASIVIDSTTAINTKREFHNEESSTYWLPKDDEENTMLSRVYMEGSIFAVYIG